MTFFHFILIFIYFLTLSACLKVQPKDTNSPNLNTTSPNSTREENNLSSIVINEDVVVFEGKIIPLRIFLSSPAAKTLLQSENVTNFRFSSLTLYSSARIFTFG